MQQDKTVYLNIGKNIRKYRLQKGLTQEKQSELICANDKFVGHVERAERVPSIKRIIKISQILEIDLKKLFDESINSLKLSYFLLVANSLSKRKNTGIISSLVMSLPDLIIFGIISVYFKFMSNFSWFAIN